MLRCVDALGFALVVLVCGVACQTVVDVRVDTDKAIQNISETMFVGVTLDSSLISNHWHDLNFSDMRLVKLTKALSPCYLRVGGVAGDALTFDPDVTERSLFRGGFPQFETNFTMSARDWDEVNTFVNNTGLSLIFGLNAIKRTNLTWNPSNALTLLDYTQHKGYKLAGLELGDEPDRFLGRFDVYVSPDQMGSDALAFRKLLRNNSYYNNTLIIGPDTGGAFIYLDEYLDVDGGKAIDTVTYHHYSFIPEEAEVVMYTEPHWFDKAIKDMIDALDMAADHVAGKQVWIGETSTTAGAGTANISDTYVAGFLWLDKLGAAAKYGIKAVLRQDLYGSYNSLLQKDTYQPNTDYWLTLLFRSLVGSRVFNVTTTGDNSVRVYAHCVRNNSIYHYKPGSVVLYAINLNPANISLSLPQFTAQPLDVFWLTPQHGDLQSKVVELNGQPLYFNNGTFPPLNPTKLSSYVTMPSMTMGFIVLPEISISACL